MRRQAMGRLVVGLTLLALPLACAGVETTGDELIRFKAYAGGPRDANGGKPCGAMGSGEPLTLEAMGGYEVTLTSAALQIGAVYLIEGEYNGGSQNSSCFELGTYCGQVPGGVTEQSGGPGINLLCPDATEFSVFGNGTADLAGIGEIWLTGGQHTCTTDTDGGTSSCTASSPDINATTDTTPIVTLTGFVCPPGVLPCVMSTKGAVSFQATVTISQDNRGVPSNPALPGDNPICKERIIQRPLDIQLFQGGSLYVRADPRGWLNQVDFSIPTCDIGDEPTCDGACCGLQELSPATATAPAIYEIPDTSASTIGTELFGGITGGALPSGASVYSFEFTASE